MKTIIQLITYFSLILLFLIGCGGENSNKIEEDTKKPVFTSSSTKSVIEGTKEILTITATDENNITYRIIDGDDKDRVEIDSKTGILSFVTEPDFENPIDFDKNNIYIFTVGAEDNSTNLQTLAMVVTVTDNINDNGPQFLSESSFEIIENIQLNFSVDASGAVNYEIFGEDYKRFDFNSSTGKLTFLNFIPDFENPSDLDRNNIYKLEILAIDNNDINSTQTLIITVTDDTSDNSLQENRVKIYKTGADDGIVEGDAFGADRNFTQKIVGGDRVIEVGARIWQDSMDNTQASYTFGGAQTYCSNLNYAGETNWRTPNRHEIYEIINYDYNNTYSTTRATIDDIFINSTNGVYWTSENVLGHSGQVIYNEAFAVSFRSGLSHSWNRDTASYVRCVSGDILRYENYIEKGANDIYSDPKTGLQWAKAAGPESMTDAKNRCENLVFATYDDWRLPNISELHTVMPSTDTSKGYPYGKHFLFKDLETVGPYISSTKLREGDGKYVGRYIGNYWNYGVWAVENNESTPQGRDVQNDKTVLLDNDDSIFSFCVRGGYL